MCSITMWDAASVKAHRTVGMFGLFASCLQTYLKTVTVVNVLQNQTCCP